MQPGGEAHAHRRGIVPLVLATGVHVGVVVAEQHADALGAAGPHGGQLHPGRLGDVGGDGRGGVSGDHQTVRRTPRDRTGLPGGEHLAEVGHADGGGVDRAVDHQCDAHAGVLAGAVQRVDDPDALAVQSHQVVGGLLGEHGIVRSVPCQGARYPVLGDGVASRTELSTAQQAHVADPLEDLAGPQGEAAGERLVVDVGRHGSLV